MSRLLITGAAGQLGRKLAAAASSRFAVRAPARPDLDITDADAVHAVVADFDPDLVINAAAYTAVDRAESEPERAAAVNVHGARAIAAACRAAGARLLHVSTDFVFDGRAHAPYPPDAPTRPLNVYGTTKRDGERAVMDASGGAATIVRTAWVYGPGGQNFVRTMLRLMLERESLSVVADQVGSPTSAADLAGALLALGQRADVQGRTLHWTNAGSASWYELASAVRSCAIKRWPDARWGRILPTDTAGYPTPARRPMYSVLDTRDTDALIGPPPHWQSALERALLTGDDDEWLPPGPSVNRAQRHPGAS